ncbi:MAG: hypothetical protein RMJ86_02555 [Anaerolineae bacterium]|nr:hypothetical protein [Thermoflexales bacterium]MDW8053414.1 hypothetical protein [Anaerolineae bacterium]
MPTIVDLPTLVAALPEPARARFERLFFVQLDVGELRVPPTMREWVRQRFGSVEAVERQQVVRVVNRITFEGALYNPLRAQRPVPMLPVAQADTEGERFFADPLRTTAEDVFGRVQGQHCVTTSNIARWERWHAVVIFNERDPLRLSREALRESFAVSLEWAQHAHALDSQARYFVWMWNGGLKGGASIQHAHVQIALGRGMHYSRIEFLRRVALAYRAQHASDYFDDLFAAHADLGLGFSLGTVRGFVYLAAQRPKETWLIGTAFDAALADALHTTLQRLAQRTGLQAFNVVACLPPLFADGSDEDWRGFPCFLRIADRGPAGMIASDIGAIDLYAHSAINADPFVVYQALVGDECALG